MQKKRRLFVIAVCCLISLVFYFTRPGRDLNHLLHIVQKPKSLNISSDAMPATVHNQTFDPLTAYPPRTTKAKVILILAYMHTGSTFLGSILQQYPGTFYDYESLRSLQQDNVLGTSVVYMNGTERRPRTRLTEVDVTMATDAVSKMITCRHGSLDISTLSRFYFSLKNPVMRDTAAYFSCIHVNSHHRTKHLKNLHVMPSRFSAPSLSFYIPIIKRCLPFLTKKCENATVRIIKFIRMRMEVVENLLKKFPEIKIIYLTRDPRAMLDSQVRKNDMDSKKFDYFVQNTISMCGKMQRDLKLLPVLNETFPNSIYPVQYEKFVQSPLKETESLFEFLGLNFTDAVKDYVASKTILSEPSSAERAQIWRSHISVQHLNVIDANCAMIYQELGYIKLSSILDIRNTSKATFQN